MITLKLMYTGIYSLHSTLNEILEEKKDKKRTLKCSLEPGKLITFDHFQ